MRSIWKEVCHHSMQCLTHIFSVRSLFEKKHFIDPFLLKTTHSQSAPHIHLLDESMTYFHRIHHRVANSTAGLTSSSSCVVQMQIRKLFNDANDPKSGTPFVLCDIRHTSFLCTQCLLSWWEKMRKIWTPIKCGLWTNILFISHRRSEAIFIVFILYSLSTVDVSCVLVFVNKYLVK